MRSALAVALRVCVVQCGSGDFLLLGGREKQLSVAATCFTYSSKRTAYHKRSLNQNARVFLQVGVGHAGLPADAVKLLSPSGQLLALRHDMRQPFAAWLASQVGPVPPEAR